MRCSEYPVLSLISDNYSGVSMSAFLSPQTFPSSDTSLSSGVSQSPAAPLCLTSCLLELVIRSPHVCQDHLQEEHPGLLSSVRLRPQFQPRLWPREVTKHQSEQPRQPQILDIQQRLQQLRQPRVHLLQLHRQVRVGQ